MKWNILSKGENIIDVLLENRGIKSKKDFLDPKYPDFKLDFGKAILRIKKAIKNKEKIIVYGDYDADGICATAIMWEALRDAGADALPFIPSREKEGYGLSIEGLKDLEAKLVITVDNGIVAHEAVEFANSKGVDVIIIDHHEKPEKLPKAYAIVHSTKLCAAGLTYFVAKEIAKPSLELAAIATVTDLMSLTDINRAIVKYGLEELKDTKRVGLRALFEVAGLEKIGTYEIGYMIGPRLNASGRIESALTALRLLCTNNKDKAMELAKTLNDTNKERQSMTEEMTIHAKSQTKIEGKIIVVEHETYHSGVIGLIAGKLVEKYYLPAIVISKGEEVSKASARSILGFNIIEAIRSSEEMLINAGGHPMAAGFTIANDQISNFRLQILKYADKYITDDMLEKTLRIDMELELGQVNMGLFEEIKKMEPFGMGNPEPVFASKVVVQNVRTVGQEGKHLKLSVDGMDAIGFNFGYLAGKIKIGQIINLAYSIDLNIFNGKTSLQLKVRDIILD